MPQVKALVLLSGGLDSMLAAKVLEEQDIKIQPICFSSAFFSCAKAQAAAKSLGWELEVIDISQDILNLVKNPPNGYGKNLNPCIDCHALMMKKAGEISQGHYDIIATGEVLGQRPFSQNKDALVQVEKLAGVEILRPLSAKLLLPTQAENNGLVKRSRLLDITGRSRTRQLELVKKYDIKEYSSPAGGCLLTDPEFSQRLMKMLDYWPECATGDVELLKYGRIFWFNSNKEGRILVVIGRNEKENQALEKLATRGDILLELNNEMGPTTLIRFKNLDLRINNRILDIEVPNELKMSELKLGETKNTEEVIDIAGLLTGYYSAKARGKKVKIAFSQRN